VIQYHREKIAHEKRKTTPDFQNIAYWEKEIRSRQNDIDRLNKKLDYQN